MQVNFIQMALCFVACSIFQSESIVDISMEENDGSEVMGKAVFYLTFIAVLVFFWWLLIYDHGIAPTQH